MGFRFDPFLRKEVQTLQHLFASVAQVLESEAEDLQGTQQWSCLILAPYLLLAQH